MSDVVRHRPKRKVPLTVRVVVALLVSFCGVVLIVDACTPVPDEYAETTGVVIERHHQGRSGDDTTIRFTALDGETYQFRSEHSGSEGSRVKVSYDPDDPGGTAETSADHTRVDLILFSGIGAFFLWRWFVLGVRQRRAASTVGAPVTSGDAPDDAPDDAPSGSGSRPEPPPLITKA